MNTVYYVALVTKRTGQMSQLGPFATEAQAKRCARVNAKCGWYIASVVKRELPIITVNDLVKAIW